MHVSGAQRARCLSLLDVYLAWRRTQEAGLADVDVRRQLREKKGNKFGFPETQKWLEVSTPVSIDMVVDGVHMKTRVAVVLQGQLKEGIVAESSTVAMLECQGKTRVDGNSGH